MKGCIKKQSNRFFASSFAQGPSLRGMTIKKSLQMIRLCFLLFFVLPGLSTFSQLQYTLTYKDSSASILHVSIEPANPVNGVVFIMPRSVPGHYAAGSYDKYIRGINAISTDGEKLAMFKDEDDAPRWYLRDTGKAISRVDYEVDCSKMERSLVPGDASIIRSDFAGLLNYSVFGWIEGTEKQPLQCRISTFSNWPVFSTLHPQASPVKGSYSFTAENYYTLADGQLYIGPGFRVKEYKGPVPLFIVSYCQGGEEYIEDYGQQGLISMGVLKEYFGELPFAHYSILLRKAVPLEPGSAPALAMEHLASSTFFGDTSGKRKAPMSKERVLQTLPTYLHHMSHAILPLRCYGDTYRPYVQEIPPIMNNIWFNEGFMWFLPYDTLHLPAMKTRFEYNVYHASPIIKKMTLSQLSQAASTMYGSDFRLGRAVYSRGAMMAIEMNDYIKEKTGGKKSMKDVFRYLYTWAKENKRAFTMEEFPGLINKACGVDLGAIYEKWQQPIK